LKPSLAPHVTALLELIHNVGDGVTLIFGSPDLQSSNDLAGSPKGEGEGVSKDLTSSHDQ
jgi:hypothetical protein